MKFLLVTTIHVVFSGYRNFVWFIWNLWYSLMCIKRWVHHFPMSWKFKDSKRKWGLERPFSSKMRVTLFWDVTSSHSLKALYFVNYHIFDYHIFALTACHMQGEHEYWFNNQRNETLSKSYYKIQCSVNSFAYLFHFLLSVPSLISHWNSSLHGELSESYGV